MKRNRLLNSSSQSRLFSNNDLRSGKSRHILTLSLLAITGIFLTTIVLATSEPASIDAQSTVIALPNQSINEDSQNTTTIALPKPATNNIYSQKPVSAPITSTDQEQPISELLVEEQTELEQLHIQQVDEANETANDTVPEPIVSQQLNWKEVKVKSGDNLSLIFPRVGLSARDVYNVAQLGKEIRPLLNLKPGQMIRFGLTEDDQGKVKLQRLELNLSAIEILQISAAEDGFQTHTEIRQTESIQKQVSGSIQSSLFEAGLQAGMTDKLIMEMAHIFGWDIDFALDIRQGDSFKVIFDETFLDGKKIDDGDILAAEFTNQGKTFRAVRYTDAEGNSHFYAPNGDSMRKTFSRTPVHFSRISSRFNPDRKHPVLNTNRPHKGVDYAAATGTPILATGDGKVEFIGNKGGYGRVIILSHGGKYTTVYGHMSKFKAGLKLGSRVKQGQTIGYVGMSGLATGPHLHYEFRVNGVHRNPLTVTLPKAEPLPKKYLDDFHSKAQPLLAQLDQASIPTIAANQ